MSSLFCLKSFLCFGNGVILGFPSHSFPPIEAIEDYHQKDFRSDEQKETDKDKQDSGYEWIVKGAGNCLYINTIMII